MARPNPYSPGFGIDPPALAGRGELLEAVLSGLIAGPRNPLFGMGIAGDRGVGKTVVLNELERRVRDRLGWPVVVHQAIKGESLLSPLLGRVLDDAASKWLKAKTFAKELDKEFSASLNVGVFKASATASGATVRSEASLVLERLFRSIGRFAQEHGTGVLITIDEAQSVRVEDLRILSAAMQLVVKRQQLPVAVILSGLPELRHLCKTGGTFFERLTIRDVENLGPEQSEYALIKPAADEGVSFAPDALGYLVERSIGYPYFLQQLGYEAWEVAAGKQRITIDHARRAAELAQQEMDKIYGNRWEDLSDLERSYVKSVALHGPGEVAVADVQRDLGRTGTQLATTRSSLINEHHLLVGVRYGFVRLGLPGFGEWIRKQSKSK